MVELSVRNFKGVFITPTMFALPNAYVILYVCICQLHITTRLIEISAKASFRLKSDQNWWKVVLVAGVTRSYGAVGVGSRFVWQQQGQTSVRHRRTTSTETRCSRSSRLWCRAFHRFFLFGNWSSRVPEKVAAVKGRPTAAFRFFR